MPAKAFIFDFDGTVVDSEPNYAIANKAFLNSLGIELAKAEADRFVGIGTVDFLTWLIARFSLPHTLEELTLQAEQTYMEIARKETRAFPEVVAFAKAVRARGCKTAIASGTNLAVLHELTRQLALEQTFDAIFSAQQVEKGKPAPDLFLYTAKSLRVSPEQCVVLEDSEPGVLAAKAAGMACLAMPIEERFAEPVFQEAAFAFPGGQNFSAAAMLHALDKGLL